MFIFSFVPCRSSSCTTSCSDTSTSTTDNVDVVVGLRANNTSEEEVSSASAQQPDPPPHQQSAGHITVSQLRMIQLYLANLIGTVRELVMPAACSRMDSLTKRIPLAGPE